LVQKIDHLAAAGVDWVQIREKDLPAREIALLTREALQITARSSAGQRARVLINDRVDVAIAEGAGGIHLGENSLPIAEAKRLIRSALKQGDGETFLTGVSCHSVEAAQAAERDGADYVFFGPVFATPSKEVFGPPQGTERLKEICRSVSIPVLAIGGITMENGESCMVAGAAGLAAIRLFQDAVDPISAIERLRQLVSYHRLR
jgi:thiamine-phosphate pyrophosphorylase